MPRALLLNGAVGVGKTTTLLATGALLVEREIPRALVDLDWLRDAWPTPPDDRFHLALQLANFSALATNFLAAGTQVLVAAGVVEDRDQRDRHATAVGCPLTVVRLRAPSDLVHARLAARHRGDDDALRWHLDRHDELTTILDQAAVDDVIVDAGFDSPREVAARVLDRVDLSR